MRFDDSLSMVTGKEKISSLVACRHAQSCPSGRGGFAGECYLQLDDLHDTILLKL